MLKGVSWQIVGVLFARALMLLGGILCVRILGQEDYGKFSLVRSTIVMFVAIGSVGMGLIATKCIASFRNSEKERIPSICILTYSFACIFGLFISIILLFGAPLLAISYLHSSDLTLPIRISSILLFITIINGAQFGMLAGFEDFKSIAINMGIGSVCEFCAMLFGAKFYGIIGALLGFGFGYFVLGVANIISVNKDLRLYNLTLKWSLFNKKDIKYVYSYGIPSALTSIMTSPTEWINRAYLGKKCSFSEISVYDVASQWQQIILFVPVQLSEIVLPILSNIIGTSSSTTKQYWKVLYLNIAVNAIIVLLIVVGVICLRGNILSMYGKEYTNVIPLTYLSISCFFAAIGRVVGSSIQSLGKIWLTLYFNIVYTIIAIFSSILFVNNGMGATGVALAVLVAYIVHTFIQVFYLIRKNRYDLSYKSC